jgi:formamidopyrimidine-DNA glycosylase
MPELPEVETVRRGLNTLIIGRKVAAVEHDTPKGFPNSTADVKDFLIGATITDVRRRAKVLLIDLSTKYTLVIHLKMTGQLVFISGSASQAASPQGRSTGGNASLWRSARPDGDIPSDKQPAESQVSSTPASQERFGAGHPNGSLIGELPDKSTRVTLTFADGARLYFNDQRKFGWMKLMPTLEVPNIDFMKKVGPEPLEADFTPEVFAARFVRRPRTSIKAALLDQTVIAGVGNIYADESLWGAKIHPLRKVETITHDEFQRLYTELRAMMNLAIEKGGSTDKNYVNAEGKRGSYLDFARVFRREGKPCPRCGTTIIKFKAAGRGTHICPHCQVLGEKA